MRASANTQVPSSFSASPSSWPFLRLSLPPSHVLRRLEAPPDTCGASRHNQVAAAIEYFKLSCIGEVVATLI
ncbi:hypothetical protein BDD14_6220 [Edaphobacter modestus]|uniref:Uncharacterized protein n=1 Tax=Edaphobacter modestus TaxID=388466 RepID=A0A4V2G1L1_9BACT|nr:hypothetical protein BDD14_6220 [Edaphobacter modestus]